MTEPSVSVAGPTLLGQLADKLVGALHGLRPGLTPGAAEWALWKRACAGHGPSAVAIVRRLTPQAHGLAMQLLRNTEDAQDVVQESFLRLWNCHPSDALGAQLATFFNTIVINRCKTHLTRKRELTTGHETLIVLADAHQQALGIGPQEGPHFTASQLQQAMAQLPARQRMALAMWAYTDAEVADIARALDIESNAAHQLLFRAKNTLRTILQGASTCTPPK